MPTRLHSGLPPDGKRVFVGGYKRLPPIDNRDMKSRHTHGVVCQWMRSTDRLFNSTASRSPVSMYSGHGRNRIIRLIDATTVKTDQEGAIMTITVESVALRGKYSPLLLSASDTRQWEVSDIGYGKNDWHAPNMLDAAAPCWSRPKPGDHDGRSIFLSPVVPTTCSRYGTADKRRVVVIFDHAHGTVWVCRCRFPRPVSIYFPVARRGPSGVAKISNRRDATAQRRQGGDCSPAGEPQATR